VVPVGDEGDAADAPAGTDPQLCDRLVAEKAHDGGDGDRPEIRDRLGVHDTQYRLVPREHGAEEDRQHDGDAGQVLDAPEAIGVALGRQPAGVGEGDPQRHGGECVADVVHRVGEQGHAAGEQDDGDLDCRGDRKDDERPLDR